MNNIRFYLKLIKASKRTSNLHIIASLQSQIGTPPIEATPIRFQVDIAQQVLQIRVLQTRALSFIILTTGLFLRYLNHWTLIPAAERTMERKERKGMQIMTEVYN